MKTEISSMLFWIVGGLFFLYTIVRGWQRGIVRQSLVVFAVVAAYFAGSFGGRLLVPILRMLGWPDLALSLVSGCLMGLLVYLCISSLGAVLFKKTSQQDILLVRWGYGLGGAMISVLFGVFLLWFLLISLRLLGTIAETELKSTASRDPGMLVRVLADLKQTLEQSPAGGVIQRVDPLQGRIHTMMSNLTRVLSQPSAKQKLMETPGLKKLADHPKIRALLNDPEIARGVVAHDYFKLLKNPRVVEVFNDPKVQEAVRQIDLEKSLELALRGEAPLPSPARAPSAH